LPYTVSLLEEREDLEQLIHTLGFIKQLTSDEKSTAVVKLLNYNLIDKLFDIILFFKDDPRHLTIPLRILQDLSYGNDFITEHMINKKISEVLEKIVNTYQNSVHKDSNVLLIDVYFLLANLVAGYPMHTDYFVFQSNLIKQLFQLFKHKKGVPRLTYEMIIVVRNIIKNGGKQTVLEMVKYKIIDFITEIIYNTSDTDTIIASLDCLSSLLARIDLDGNYSCILKQFEQITGKLENFRLHKVDRISLTADCIMESLSKANSQSDIII
jgi:hypothetical protein